MKKTLLTIITAAALVAGVPAADAGRGGSHARIQNAIATGSVDAIIAEIERAERLICSSACIETVMRLLDDSRYEIREVAAWWIARRPAQKQEIVERSVAYLAGSDSIAIRNAADALGAFREAAAIPALADTALRTDISAEARMHVARALGDIGHAAANPALVAAMQDADADVRLAALSSWLAIRGQVSAAPAVGLITDANIEVRRKATAVAGSLRDASAREALEAQLAADTDPSVRRNAAWALGRIGSAASRPALQAATGDPSPLVRQTARAALRELR